MPDPNPMRIVLIEDHEATREFYTHFLREAGFTVEEAINGKEGLEKIEATKPDLVITGIMMPEMDGFALIQKLKEEEGTMQIPIVILSHLGRQADETRFMELGAADFIVRDITTPREILHRLSAILSGAEYVVEISQGKLDALRLAGDMGLSKEFTDAQEPNQRYALRLRRTDAETRRFDADIIPLN